MAVLVGSALVMYSFLLTVSLISSPSRFHISFFSLPKLTSIKTSLPQAGLIILFIVSFYLSWTSKVVTSGASTSSFSSPIGSPMGSQEVQESMSSTTDDIDGFRSGAATFQIWRVYRSILKCRFGELQNRFTSFASVQRNHGHAVSSSTPIQPWFTSGPALEVPRVPASLPEISASVLIPEVPPAVPEISEIVESVSAPAVPSIEASVPAAPLAEVLQTPSVPLAVPLVFATPAGSISPTAMFHDFVDLSVMFLDICRRPPRLHSVFLQYGGFRSDINGFRSGKAIGRGRFSIFRSGELHMSRFPSFVLDLLAVNGGMYIAAGSSSSSGHRFLFLSC